MIRNQVISSLKWLATAKLAGQGIAAVISIVVIRLLEPTDYGLMAMAMMFLGLILLLNEMGLGSALVQQEDLGRREMEQVLGLLLTVNVALYAVVFLLAPVLAAFFKEPRLVPVIRVLSLRLPMMSLLVVPRAMLQRNMKFRLKSLVDLSGTVVASLATLTLAWLGYGVWSLVFGILVAGVIEVCGMMLASRVWLRPRFSLQGMRRQASFGGMLTVDRVLWYVYTQSDALIVGRLLGNGALGLYYVAKRVASLPLDRVGGILNEVAFAAYSRVQRDMPAFRAHYCKAARMASFVGFPVCFGISAIAPNAVPLVLGPKWLDSVLILQLNALTIPLRQLNVLNTPALLGIGRPDVNVVNLLFALAIMPAAFLVGSKWGLVGVALAWVVAYPVYFMIMLARSLPILGISLRQYFDAVWPSFTAALAMYSAVALSQWGLELVHATRLSSLVVGIVVGMLSFAAAIWLLRPALVQEVLALIRRRRRA